MWVKLGIVPLVVALLLLSGCPLQPTGPPTGTGLPTLPAVDDKQVEQLTEEAKELPPKIAEEASKIPPSLAKEIAKLPPLEIDSVESYEEFEKYADAANALVRLLNREGGFDLDKIEVSFKSYQKFSRVVKEYGPLINNYNETISTAKEFEEGNPEKEKAFYMAIGKFGLETTIIFTAVYAKAAFGVTGYLYRASGLNRLAFSCPTCVSVILSQTHWFIRGVMVEESSHLAEIAVNELDLFIQNPNEKIQETQETVGRGLEDTKNWAEETIGNILGD